MDNAELARESLERAHETSQGHHSTDMTRVAVMISVLAAALALSEMGEKASQNEYLTHHVALSDAYAYYQARTIRGNVLTSEASVLESLPGAAGDPAIQKKIATARGQIERMNDDPKAGEGRKQLLEKAKVLTEQRDHAFHLYHQYEMVVGALQIAIVLASVSVVTRIRSLTAGAGLIGGGAIVYGLLVAAGTL